MKQPGSHQRVVILESSRAATARINPDDYRASTLISEFADAWVARSKLLAPTTTANYAACIRHLGTFLNETQDRFLTMSGDGHAVAVRLHNWEEQLIKEYLPPSTRGKKMAIQIRALAQYWLQDNAIDATVLADWASGNVLDQRRDTSVPLDEFSNAERIALRDTCRQIVRETERRLRLGETLLASGRDPRKHGWKEIENLVWAIANIPFEEAYRDEVIGPQCREYARRIAELANTRPSGVNFSTCLPALAGLFLAPTPEYVLAIRVLLHLETGWSPEESRFLLREDVVHEGDKVRVKTTKRRANRVRWEHLPTSGGLNPGWKSGDLIIRAMNSMKFSHINTTEKSPFWVAGSVTYVRQPPEDYPGFSIRPVPFKAKARLKSLIERQNLQISEPHDMRRLRKTVKSIRAATLGTLHGSAGDDHSVEVFQGYYAPVTTVNTVAAHTVIRAQEKALRRALRGPTVVTKPATELVDCENLAMAQIAGEVANESDVEKELTLAGCSAPYSSPFAKDGSLCHAAPSLCLQCPNALVFKDHLPRLVAYETILKEIQKSLSPVVFDATYGEQNRNLQTILSLFGQEDLNRARTNPAPLHRSLGEMGTF